jgi:hypothetical protein
MNFAVYCLDKPGHAPLRAENRAAHLDYLKSFGSRVVAAGPLLDDDGQQMVGSLLILEFEGRAELDAFLAGDPYAKAGLFRSVEVRPWRKAIWQS